MIKYREILRLRAMGVSLINTAHSCRCSPTTVQEVEKRARKCGINWPLPEEVNDAAIREQIYPKKSSAITRFPIDHKKVARELSRRGVTLVLCWNEYCDEAIAQGELPFQYSAFCDRHRAWEKQNAYTMHVGARCGEKVEVDWAGDAAQYINPDTGEIHKAWVFVACLPWSQYTFAEAFDDMGEVSWITAHVHAFEFFEGCAPILVPDNCKTGVIKNTIEELIINEQYRRMAEYYGCAVVPARPRRPRDKGSVEAAVGLVERQALAPLRNKVFLSLEELNDAIAKNVEKINSRPFQKRKGSRKSEYLGQEKDSLIPLPTHPYRIVVHRCVTVQFNYHICFEGMYYSVPYTYLRKKAEIEATSCAITIFIDGVRVATHARLYGHPGQYSTNSEHMPDAHRDYAEWNGDRFRRWAAEKGPSVAKVVDGLLCSRTIEQQAYRSCRALLELGRRQGYDVLEKACAKALTYTRAPSYKTVKTIVAKLAAQASEDPKRHAYLRGDNYYNN